MENREFVVVMITTNYSECHKEDLDKKVMTPPGNSSAAPGETCSGLVYNSHYCSHCCMS